MPNGVMQDANGPAPCPIETPAQAVLAVVVFAIFAAYGALWSE